MRPDGWARGDLPGSWVRGDLTIRRERGIGDVPIHVARDAHGCQVARTDGLAACKRDADHAEQHPGRRHTTDLRHRTCPDHRPTT